MSGMEPKTLDRLAKKDDKPEESARCSGIVHGCRLGFSEMLSFCKPVKPRRNWGGTEENLLLSRNMVRREVRLERAGREPESWFFWRARVWSRGSWLMSAGKVPESDLEARLMVVTWPAPSQTTPGHLQWLLPDQPEGVGERAAASLDMKAASSAAVAERERER